MSADENDLAPRPRKCLERQPTGQPSRHEDHRAIPTLTSGRTPQL